VALANSGDFEGALRSANEALALNPRFYDAQVLMVRIMEQLHRPEEARAHAAAARELKPMLH
jgi:Flp pilus assembly protein TadD